MFITLAFSKSSNQLLSSQQHPFSRSKNYPPFCFLKAPQYGLPKALPVEGAPFVSYWNPIFSITKKKETWNDDR